MKKYPSAQRLMREDIDYFLRKFDQIILPWLVCQTSKYYQTLWHFVETYKPDWSLTPLQWCLIYMCT